MESISFHSLAIQNHLLIYSDQWGSGFWPMICWIWKNLLKNHLMAYCRKAPFTQIFIIRRRISRSFRTYWDIQVNIHKIYIGILSSSPANWIKICTKTRHLKSKAPVHIIKWLKKPFWDLSKSLWILSSTPVYPRELFNRLKLQSK